MFQCMFQNIPQLHIHVYVGFFFLLSVCYMYWHGQLYFEPRLVRSALVESFEDFESHTSDQILSEVCLVMPHFSEVVRESGCWGGDKKGKTQAPGRFLSSPGLPQA